MNQPADDQAVAMLRHDLPEFEERFLDLLELYGDDLTAETVLIELADFVTGLLVSCGAPGTLDRCFSVADDIARAVPGGGQLVAYALLNEIPPAARALARQHLSSAMESLLERLERGEAAEEAAAEEAGAPAEEAAAEAAAAAGEEAAAEAAAAAEEPAAEEQAAEEAGAPVEEAAAEEAAAAEEPAAAGEEAAAAVRESKEEGSGFRS